MDGPRRTILLSGIFFLSGASALLFEVLWFRQAGIAFGNSVWATSLVLASFMGGLALGNGAAARWGERAARPLRLYALAELVTGLTGLAVVLVLPLLARTLGPLFAAVGERTVLLNGCRLGIAFVLLLVPTAAMGATLPLLVKTSGGWDSVFGRVLGRLYGWNTMGAVLGSIAGEGFLIRAFGIRGTGAVAAALNLSAALLAARLASGSPPAPADAGISRPRLAQASRATLVLFAAFLSGALFLALEVVWFRFLLLFVVGSEAAFSLMLAVVLLGIASGGLAVSVWSRRRDVPASGLTVSLLATGALVVSTYAGFSGLVARLGGRLAEDPSAILGFSLYLMLPAAIASGAVFTLAGVALQAATGQDAWSTGLLTLFNTLGGMVGSLAAGFVLLPALGMERSFFVLAAGYGLAALGTLRQGTSSPRARTASLVGALVWGAALAVFPFGLMRGDYLQTVVARFGDPKQLRIAAYREGVTETITYLETELLGEPLTQRLVTNGFSMSGTTFNSNRYMKLFVYLPVALHPAPKKALLISYGVGSTARALVDTASLERIDVVDISRDILDLSRVVYPKSTEDPARNPRVRLHVEDGRFFLQTTRERYDVITGEPPPPQCAGVVSLYTREYFRLIRDRLASGGMTTYWLPVHSLEKNDALAVIRSFCDVFPSCSLWNGNTADWVLLGMADGAPRADEALVGRLWRDPGVAPELKALGFERPELVGATFLGDAAYLAGLTRETPPLVDDFPKRLLARPRRSLDDGFFVSLRDPGASQRRFRGSAFAARSWPEALREGTLGAFREQSAVDRILTGPQGRIGSSWFSDLDLVLTKTTLETPVLWMLGTERRAVEIARRALKRGVGGSQVEGILAAADLARRSYGDAERRYARLPHSDFNDALRIVLLCLDGDSGRATSLARETRERGAGEPVDAEYWTWLEARFGIR